MKNLYLLLFSLALVIMQSCSNETTSKTKESANTDKPVNNASESNVKVINLTKAQFLEKVWNFEASPDKWVYIGDKPCIVDFYADWCRPCKIAAPILEELAKEYQGQIYVYKIDTEKERELAGAFGIQSIPAFLHCPLQGEPQMSSGIASSPEETKKMFKGIIDDFLLKK